MRARKSVFVVGAGASADFGFPVGRDIASEIQSRLDIEFNENGGVGAHETPISFALGTSRRDEAYLDAARQLRAGIGVGESIDQFLMKRRNNSHVRDLGLMTLAHVILDAERKSQLMGFDANDFERSLGAKRATTMSWPAILMEYFIGDQSPEEIGSETFDETAFIIFNYDRCLEHAWLYRLHIQHHMPLKDALKIVRSVPMIHVYGTLGEIDGPVKFGAPEAPLAEISKTLRTYHDGVVDKNHATKIRSLINAAEKIIFLGFGFHSENVKLLFKNGLPKARMFGTAKDCAAVPPFSDIKNATGSEFFDCNCTSFLMNNGFRLMREPWEV